jgi:signal transduction histidine kinase/signal recognition particle receptor subunit beta
MSIINLKEKTINAKIVYYGTALGGKTTSLKSVHRVIDPEQKIELVSLNTEKDRTLFFDFLPISLGRIGDFSVRLQGFTVPGQVKYNLTRKYVLTGADAVVLVVDSQTQQLESNIAALQNLKENLEANGLSYDSIPLVLQYNKRDLEGLHTVEDLQEKLNDRDIPAFATVATTGEGVFEAFIEVSTWMMDQIADEYRIQSDESIAEALRESLVRTLERSREGAPEEQAQEDSFSVDGEVPEGHGHVMIGEGGAEEGSLPSSEELLKKAVDSNIEIARLYAEVNEIRNRLSDRVAELSALNEVGKTVSSHLDVDRLLQAALDSATSCLGSAFGSVMLVNQTGDLIEKVTRGFLEDPLARAYSDDERPDLRSLLEAAPDGFLVTEEGHADLLERVRSRDARIRYFMLVPLRANDAVTGAITIYSMNDAVEEAADRLRFLSALASHAAVALENARLVTRIEDFNRDLEHKVKERTADLQRAYEELKELDRLKDEFLSSMSHELLTPLTSIQSFSEILLTSGDAELRESGPEFLGIINQESIRLTRRLKDLLDLSQIEAGKVAFGREPLDLKVLVREAYSFVAGDYEAKGISAHITAHRMRVVSCDRKWITRAIESLLSNAAKFSDEGGEVEVELKEEGGWALVAVRDQGCGIDSEYLTQVFERFRQIGDLLTDKPTGAGLGLPLARRIVEGHDGRISVESEPGQGATFEIALPVGPVPKASPPATAPRAAPA